MQFELIRDGHLTVGDTVIIDTFSGSTYTGQILAIKLASEGVYMLLKFPGSGCIGIAFNREGRDQCAYVGLEEHELFGLISDYFDSTLR